MTKEYNVSSSSLRKSGCKQAEYNIVVEGLKSKDYYNDTKYGVAFHKFMSRAFESEGNLVEAVKAAKQVFSKPSLIRSKKDYLNESHLINTCMNYWEQAVANDDFEHLIDEFADCWKCDGKGIVTIDSNTSSQCPVCLGKTTRPQAMVEYKFRIPFFFPEVTINVCGTIDKIGKTKNGGYCFGDYKTTSSWDSDKFLNNKYLSTQMLLYFWAIKHIASKQPDSLLAKIASTRLVGFLDGIFLKSSGKDPEFIRSEYYHYTNEAIEQFGELLQSKLSDLATMIKYESHPRDGMIKGLCCDQSFICQFYPICSAPNKEIEQHVINNQFKKVFYNPFNYSDNEESTID